MPATNAGIEVVLEDLTSDLEIPVVRCMLVDHAFVTEHRPIAHILVDRLQKRLSSAPSLRHSSHVLVSFKALDTFNGLSTTARPFTRLARRHLLDNAPMVEFSVLRSEAFDDLENETDHSRSARVGGHSSGNRRGHET